MKHFFFKLVNVFTEKEISILELLVVAGLLMWQDFHDMKFSAITWGICIACSGFASSFLLGKSREKLGIWEVFKQKIPWFPKKEDLS